MTTALWLLVCVACAVVGYRRGHDVGVTRMAQWRRLRDSPMTVHHYHPITHIDRIIHDRVSPATVDELIGPTVEEE